MAVGSKDLKAAGMLVNRAVSLPSLQLGLKHPSTDAHKLVGRDGYQH